MLSGNPMAYDKPRKSIPSCTCNGLRIVKVCCMAEAESMSFKKILFITDNRKIDKYEEGESLPNTRRSRPSLNDDPSLCATLYTVSGVGELSSGDHHFCEIVTLCRPPPH